MFTREQRRSPAPLAVRRRAEAAPASSPETVPARARNVCPCGGGCPRCARRTEAAKTSAAFARPLQTKLRVNEVGDVYEQEADRAAEQVAAVPDSGKSDPLRIRRFSAGGGADRDVPESVSIALAGSGRPLDPGLRQEMEAHFQQDFSAVRIHADEAGADSARDLNAHAYAVGNDIVFGAREFAPATRAGRRLLAHELAHVVQQGGKPAAIQRDHNPDPNTVELMPEVTMTEEIAKNRVVYRFRGKTWITISYNKRADLRTNFERRGDLATQVLITIESNGYVNATVDLDVEREFTASRQALDSSALGYDFSFHGRLTVKDGPLTQNVTAPARRIVSDTTTHPVTIEGLPKPEEHTHTARWLAGNMKDSYPSFRNLGDLRAYLAANPRRSFAIVRAKDGRYIARPVTGDQIRALADRARIGNFKAGSLENIDWYKNAYQTGEFQGIWAEGQEFDDLASLRDQFFSDPESASLDNGQEVECEVYETGAIDTDLGISYARKLLSHEEATRRWHQIDKTSYDDFRKLESLPGHRILSLHARGVSKMHTIDNDYLFERDRFRRQIADIEARGQDPANVRDVLAYVRTFQTYFEAQVDRDDDDPEFVAELKKYAGLAYVYGVTHYQEVVNAGQRWAADSFARSAQGIRDFVNDDKKLTQWVLSCPSLPQRDVMQTLSTLDMMDDSLSWYNALTDPQSAVMIAAGGGGSSGKTLESIRNKALELAKKMDDGEASILKGDIIAIKQEGPFGDAVRKGVYQQYGYRLDPTAFPYKDKLPKSHAFDIEMLGGSRSSFSSLGEQMFATQLRRDVAEDEVAHWAKIIGMLVATVILVVALNAAGAAIAGAMFAEGTLGYLAVSAAVVGTGLTAAEYLQTRLAGGDMTLGQLLESEAWNVVTAGFMGRLGFAFKDAGLAARMSVMGGAMFSIGMARFMAQHKGPISSDEFLQFFIENAVMFAAMEAASALARPMTENAAFWGRARRLGIKVQEIADFNLKVNNLMRDLGSYTVRPGEAAREAPKVEATVNALLAEQERLVNDLSQKMSTAGDAAQIKAEAGEELARIRAVVEGMKRAEFLRSLGLKPIGQSQSVFSFENAPDAVQKIKDFFPDSRVEPQSDGSIRLYLPSSSDPIILNPSGPAVAGPSAAPDNKVDINRATERELATLPGIGKKLAKAIVDQRQKTGGRFATVDDLGKVPGIGPERLAKILPLVVAEDPPSIAQRQADLAARQRALLERAERQGYDDASLKEIERLRPAQTTDPHKLDDTQAKIEAAEASAGAKMDSAAKRALANTAKRLGSDRILLQTGQLSGISDAQLGDALARVAGRQNLGVNELRGVVWAHLKGVPIEKFMDMAHGFGTKSRNFALETFGRLADANVERCQRVVSDMAKSPGDWDGGMFALEIARFGFGIEQIAAFEEPIMGPGGERNIDIILKNGMRIELKNWRTWEHRTSLANASDPNKPGRFLKDVANANFDPAVFDRHRYIFRYPAPETPSNIKAYLRSQLEIYIRGKVSPTQAKSLLDAFDATRDLVIESKARAEGGVPDVPAIPPSLAVPVQPKRDDKQTPASATVGAQ